MSPASFTMWLRGFLDCAGNALTPEQLNKIRDQLGKVVDMPAKSAPQPMPQFIPVPYTVPSSPSRPYDFGLTDITCGNPDVAFGSASRSV